MSILIKGINPPKSCYTCSWYNKVECPVNDGRYYYRAQRHPSCPLIELPPHGRLIDADKFAETLKEVSIRQGYDKLFSDNILSVGDVFDAIAADLKGEGLDKYKHAPTVIEAEER